MKAVNVTTQRFLVPQRKKKREFFRHMLRLTRMLIFFLSLIDQFLAIAVSDSTRNFKIKRKKKTLLTKGLPRVLWSYCYVQGTSSRFPKKYSCNGLNKIHAKNLITKKNSCSSKIPLPLHNFSNGPSLRRWFLYNEVRMTNLHTCVLRKI